MTGRPWTVFSDYMIMVGVQGTKGGKNMDGHATDAALDLPREVFEPAISRPVKLDLLGRELELCFQAVDGPVEIKTCYGDIRKIVDALMDYARLLEMVCVQWELCGFHKITYEDHAKALRDIALKYQAGIGYDYEAALELCRKKVRKKAEDDDVGGEALEMGYRTALRKKKADAENSGKPEK